MKKHLLIIFHLLLFFSAKAQVPQYFAGNGTNGNYIPLGNNSGTWADQRAQFLYLAGEFGPSLPIGFITKIYFKANNTVSNATYTNFRVDIGQNNTTTSLSTAGWVPGLTTCLTSASFTVPTATAGQWFEIPLQTPFFFDPSKHLIIDTRQTNTTPATAIILTTGNSPSGNRRAWAASAAANPGGADQLYYWFGFDLIPGIPCNGVPTTSLTGPDEVCPNKPFTLMFSTFYAGVTRQWQTSTNGTTWTNWTGAVDPNIGSITDAITQEKWYRCIVTCIATNQSYTTPPKLVKIAPFYYCYCDGSKATSTAGIDVGNVKVTSLPGNDVLMDNGGAVPFLGNASSVNTYTDLRKTLPPIPMYHDSSYIVSMSQVNQPTTFTKAMGAIYIDFNRNGRFDVAERVLLDSTKQLPPFYGAISDTVKVPQDAGFGLTGMRVILGAGAGNPDTCASYTNGETEDYLVDLRYLPCSSAHAGTIVGDTSMCNDYDYVLLDSTYQKERHGLSHSWQVSADNVHWFDIPGSLNKDTLMRVFDDEPFYFRVTQTCSFANDTDRVAHKVNIKPAYKCYCHSQSLGGPKDTSDVGGFAIYNFEITDGGAHLANPRAVRKRQDYTDLQPIEMWVDSVYQFRVFHTMPNNFHSDGKVTVFMDFDNDRQYDLPGERVFTGFTNVGLHTIIKNIIIPDSVVVDVPTGMRVIVNNNVAPNAPSDEGCGTYTSGETEDYMMIFRRAFPSGVQEVKGIEDIQLFPNPTSGKFTIHFRSGSAVKEVKIKVLSITGQLVKEEITSHSGGRFMKEMDLSGYAKGIYAVELDADGIKSTNRLVVK